MQSPTIPSVLPRELVTLWTRTRPRIVFVAGLGAAASVMLAFGAAAMALLFVSAAPLFAIAGMLFFVAMLAFASFRQLLHHGSAITVAERTKTIESAERVLERQMHYWRMACAVAFTTFALALFVVILGMVQ